MARADRQPIAFAMEAYGDLPAWDAADGLMKPHLELVGVSCSW